MTHSNHRRGSRESLNSDYVLTLRGPKVLDEPENANKGVKILAKHNPVGLVKSRHENVQRYMRGWSKGMSLEDLANNTDPPSYITGVYESKDDVNKVVEDLTEADLGFSVVISGVFENTFDVCKDVGIEPHTVCMSMGTVGRTDLLPEPEILEITTMCGHSLISQHIVRHYIDLVKAGKISTYDASLEIGKQCMCNYMNPVRAKKIIKDYIAKT